MSDFMIPDFPYHQQDELQFCGAACAQMVLDSSGVQAGLFPQYALYNLLPFFVSADVLNWYMAPDELVQVLNYCRDGDCATASPAPSFRLRTAPSADALTRELVWHVHQDKIAPIVLIAGIKHWVAVTGYRITALDGSPTNPQGPADTAYVMKGLFLHDPWPDTPRNGDGTPRTHSHNDQCGTSAFRGTKYAYVSYAAWRNYWLTGVNRGLWTGCFVAVCPS